MGGFANPIKMAVQQGLVSQKSAEQPKVQSQMAAPQPVASPSGPTSVEMAQDTLSNKRKGRKSTILTSSLGATDQVELGYKTLLG